MNYDIPPIQKTEETKPTQVNVQTSTQMINIEPLVEELKQIHGVMKSVAKLSKNLNYLNPEVLNGL